jgi:hypothetical protein
LNAFY